MNAFTTLSSHVVAIRTNDIDTDQIIPAVYLKVTSKDGLVEGLFSGWKYIAGTKELDPNFVLNRPSSEGARILLAGDNFGCGSSREHAPWALMGWGFQAVISTSIADIFRNNSLKNGLLPIIIDKETHDQLFSLVEEDPTTQLAIDLASQTLTLPDGRAVTFPIDPFSKKCLLQGVDQLGYVLGLEEEISAYEEKQLAYSS